MPVEDTQLFPAVEGLLGPLFLHRVRQKAGQPFCLQTLLTPSAPPITERRLSRLQQPPVPMLASPHTLQTSIFATLSGMLRIVGHL